MAITKAEVLAAVIQRTGPLGSQLADIDEELRSVLYDISSRGDFLQTEGTVDTVDGTRSYALPVNFKQPLELNISGGNRLTLFEFAEYQRNLIDESSPTEGEPQEYCIFNGKLWFWPVADDAYEINVYYRSYHANSVAAIEFSEQFRETIYEGVLYKCWTGRLTANDPEMFALASQKAMVHGGNYERELSRRLEGVHGRPRFMKYHDI